MIPFILLLCISRELFAWNATVHQWIGRQALEQVKPLTRHQILNVFQSNHTHVDEVLKDPLIFNDKKLI